MNRCLIISLLVAIPIFTFGQKDPLTCKYKAKYSANQRLKFYPLETSDSVKLVSFRYHFNNYPIGENEYIKDSMVESKTLEKEEIVTLTDILYNNFYKRFTGIGVMTLCFSPRNAILFLDKNGNLKEYILICFHCDRMETSSDSVDTGDGCTSKIEKLRIFFVSKGLKFGTNKDIESYPGETPWGEGVILPPIDSTIAKSNKISLNSETSSSPRYDLPIHSAPSFTSGIRPRFPYRRF